MRRRELLISSFWILAGLKLEPALAFTAPTQKSRKLIGGFATSESRIDARHLTRWHQTGLAVSYDLATGQQVEIEIDCGGHAFCQSPLNPSLFATVAKWTVDGALVDFATKKVVRLNPPDGHRFFGHVNFAPDGTLYASAAANDGFKGVLVAHDPVTGKILRTVPTNGFAPHEFRFLDAGTVLIANTNNFGDHSTMDWVALKDGKLLRTESVPRVSHFMPWGTGRYLMGSSFHPKVPGFFSFRPERHDLRESHLPKPVRRRGQWVGEALSLAVLDDQTAAVTTQRSNGLAIWNASAERLSLLDFGVETAGLIYAEEALWMTTADGKLRRIQVDRGNPEKSKITEMSARFSNSKHLLLAEM